MSAAVLLLPIYWTNRPKRVAVKSGEPVMPVLLGGDWTNRPICRSSQELSFPRRHSLNASSEAPRRLLKRLVDGDARHRSYAVPSAAHKAI